MREKPINEDAIKRTITFIKLLYQHTKIQDRFSTSALARTCRVASGTFRAIFELNIVLIKDTGEIIWHSEKEPTESEYRKMALHVKDKLLHKNKKQQHTPLMPDWASIAKSLNDVSEKLTILTLQNESSLKRLKTPSNQISDSDLFRVSDQMLSIVISLIPTIHSNTSAYPNFTTVEKRNKLAIEIATDLFNQLLKK